MTTVSKQELKVIQAGATAIGGIVTETAKMCGQIGAGGESGLNRKSGLRGGCSALLPGILAMAVLIGLNKKGEVLIGGRNEKPEDYCNDSALLFISVLLAKMASDIIPKDDNCLLTVEFSPHVLAQALEVVEKTYGPADGKIDATILEVARKTTAVGDEAIDMLNRLVAAGRPN